MPRIKSNYRKCLWLRKCHLYSHISPNWIKLIWIGVFLHADSDGPIWHRVKKLPWKVVAYRRSTAFCQRHVMSHVIYMKIFFNSGAGGTSSLKQSQCTIVLQHTSMSTSWTLAYFRIEHAQCHNNVPKYDRCGQGSDNAVRRCLTNVWPTMSPGKTKVCFNVYITYDILKELARAWVVRRPTLQCTGVLTVNGVSMIQYLLSLQWQRAPAYFQRP